MSMFDKVLNFEDVFTPGDRFVLTGMKFEGEITTRHGKAQRTTIKTVTRDSYPKVISYSALGVGFASMAKRAERSDFPVVVEYAVVNLPEDKTLKILAKVEVTPRDWKDGEDGPPVVLEDYKSGDSETAADTDMPF